MFYYICYMKEENIKDLYPFQYYTFKNLSVIKPYLNKYMFNLEHDNELYMGNINGLLTMGDMLPVKMLKYFTSNKNHKATFILPENYKDTIDGLTGFREQVLEIIDYYKDSQIYIITYKVDNSDIINKMEGLKEMKFDVCIGNPPYEGQGNPLYLNICKQCVDISDTVVWLCPTQWTNTLKYVKWYDYYKKILKCKDYEAVGNPFNETAALANEVGIYIFKNDGTINLDELVYLKFANKDLAKSIWNKTQVYLQEHDNIWTFNQINYNKPYYVHNTGIRGNVKNGKPNWDWTTLFGVKAHTDFSKATTKFDSTQIMWNFDTIDECRNFIDCLETDIFMFLLYCVKMNNNNHRGECKYLPWFSDYTHKWSELQIAQELGLTKEEIDYIHEEMKDFGWKAAIKK